MEPPAVPLLALALAAALLLPAVAANGDDWNEEERRVEVEVRPDGFELRSDRLGGAQPDRIRLRLDGGNAEFRFELMSTPTAQEVEAGLRIRLERIVEFLDANGDRMFQASEPVRTEFDLGDLTLAGVYAEDVTSDGVSGKQVTANYTFAEYPGAVVGFRATAFGILTNFAQTGQRPVETKIDILLDGFPYVDELTSPAVELRVRSESDTAAEVVRDTLSFSVDDLTAFFRWKRTAAVDGETSQVGVTVTIDEAAPGELETFIAFAYARGTAMVHDPTIGFFQTPAGVILGNPALYALGVIAAAAVFAILALARRGRKVKPR